MFTIYGYRFAVSVLLRADGTGRIPNRSDGPSMTPTVSIVIPTFNGEAFLDQTLANVRKQGFADWEIIAVDDGSGDGTMDILRRNLEHI